MTKNCWVCNSNSTVQDGVKWVCWQHIKYEAPLGNPDRISATVEEMEFQSPDVHTTKSQGGEGRN